MTGVEIRRVVNLGRLDYGEIQIRFETSDGSADITEIAKAISEDTGAPLRVVKSLLSEEWNGAMSKLMERHKDRINYYISTMTVFLKAETPAEAKKLIKEVTDRVRELLYRVYKKSAEAGEDWDEFKKWIIEDFKIEL